MARFRLLLLAASLWLLAPPLWSPARAGVLAPTKASQVVTASGFAGSSACPTLTAYWKVDTQQNPDGTTAPFNVPLGQVLAMTSYEWTVSGAAPSHLASVVLTVAGPSGSSFVSMGSAIADGSGNAAGSVVLPSSIVVKTGVELCFEGSGGGTAVIVHGFFAKDR